MATKHPKDRKYQEYRDRVRDLLEARIDQNDVEVSEFAKVDEVKDKDGAVGAWVTCRIWLYSNDKEEA